MNPCNDDFYKLLASCIGGENEKKFYEYLAKHDFCFTGKGFMSYYERKHSRKMLIDGSRPTELTFRSRSSGHRYRTADRKTIFAPRRKPQTEDNLR